MGSICTASPQTVVQQSTPSPYVTAAFNDISSRAQALSNQPYTPYTGPLVAGLTPDQQQAISRITGAYGTASPYLDLASQYGTAGAQPITNEMIQPLMSPYTQDVVNATLGNLREQFGQTLSGIKGNAIAQNAMGGSREAIAEAEAARQFNLSAAPTIAGLYNQAYNQAANLAQQNLARQAQAGYFFGNLGPIAQSTLLGAGQAGLSAAGLQQQTQQQQYNAAYQQYLQQLAFPYQQLSFLAGTEAPFLSAFGPTQTQTTYPSTPSLAQSAIGLGTVGVGAYGALNKASGGRMPYQFGGVAEGAEPFNVMAGSPYGGGGGGPFAGIGKASPIGLGSTMSYVPGGGSIKPISYSPYSFGKDKEGGQGENLGKPFGQDPSSLMNLGKGLGSMGSKAWDFLTPSQSGVLGAEAAPIDTFVGPAMAGPDFVGPVAGGAAEAGGIGSMLAGLGEGIGGIGSSIMAGLESLGPAAALLLAKRGGRVSTGDSFLDTVHAMHGTLRKLQMGGGVEDPVDETIAPGPAERRLYRDYIRGGESAPIGLVPNRLAASRSRFIDETNDPAVRDRLMRLTEAEVGGQGPLAANAFMESVLNRASARGQPLRYAMNDPNYYPNVSLRGRNPSTPQIYSDALERTLDSSNLARFATGNASGTVGFAGGPQTYNPGTGERFGIEGPDKPWATAMAYAPSGGPGGGPDAEPTAMPVALRDTPAGAGSTALAMRGRGAPAGASDDLARPRLDAQGNLIWPSPQPDVKGTGIMSDLARGLGVSKSDLNLGLISAGLGMIAGNPRGNASGFTGMLAGVAQGAQTGLGTLMEARKMTDTAMQQAQQQRIQQQNVDISRQRAEFERYHAPIFDPMGDYAVSFPKNPWSKTNPSGDRPVYYPLNPDGSPDMSKPSDRPPKPAAESEAKPTHITVAPMGARVVEAPPEEMTGVGEAGKAAESNPKLIRASYFDPKSRAAGFAQAKLESQKVDEDAKKAAQLDMRAKTMRSDIDAISRFVKSQKDKNPLLAKLFDPGTFMPEERQRIINTGTYLGVPLPQDVVAAINRLGKETVLGGFQNIVNAGLSAREAQPIINAAVKAMPAFGLPEETSRYLLASTEALAQWHRDRQAFLTDYRGKNGGYTNGWEAAFERKFSNSRYVAQAIWARVPEEERRYVGSDVKKLRAARDDLISAENAGDTARADAAREKFMRGKQFIDEKYLGLGNYFAFGTI